MSVAFRRESDDEHLEPTFELPLPPGPNLVTARGRQLIADRITALEGEIEATDDAEAVKKLRRDLRYWQTRRATAIETRPRDDGAIGFGNRVTFTLAGKQRAVTLVGDDEAPTDQEGDLLVPGQTRLHRHPGKKEAPPI